MKKIIITIAFLALTMHLMANENKTGGDASIRAKVLAIAKKELGVKEDVTSGDNPRVVEFLHATSLGETMASQDETPWCAAFVNWVLKKAGLKGTGSAAARSFLKFGIATNKPQAGDIVVFSRDGGGHVTFYISETKDKIKVLGGNQSDSVSISEYSKDRLLGFRTYAA